MDFIHKYQYLYMVIPILLSGLLFSLPIFGKIVNTPEKNRYASIDGVRYFLASSVFFSHSYLIMLWLLNGKWDRLQAEKLAYLADIAVSIFFIISVFLFWGIIKRDTIDWTKLYINRFFRLAPLVIFQTIISIFILLYLTGSTFNLQTTRQTLPWFDIFNNTKPDIGGYTDSWKLTAGVYWTLVYEWGFYFSLPLLWFFRKNSKPFVLSLCFFIVYVSSYLTNLLIPFQFIFLFILGMLALEVKEDIRCSSIVLNLTMLLCIIIIVKFRLPSFTVSSYSNLLLFVLFICIIKGGNFFGLLSMQGFIRLGHLSYSIYIIHGIICFTMYKLFLKLNLLPEYFLLISYLTFLLTLIVSAITHRYIEIYFYSWCKRKF